MNTHRAPVAPDEFAQVVENAHQLAEARIELLRQAGDARNQLEALQCRAYLSDDDADECERRAGHDGPHSHHYDQRNGAVLSEYHQAIETAERWEAAADDSYRRFENAMAARDELVCQPPGNGKQQCNLPRGHDGEHRKPTVWRLIV